MNFVESAIEARSCHTVAAQRKKTLTVIAEQFLMTDDPGRKCTAAGNALLGVYSSQATPFPHREFRLADEARNLVRGVPILHRALLDELVERHFDSFQSARDVELLDGHDSPRFLFSKGMRRRGIAGVSSKGISGNRACNLKGPSAVVTLDLWGCPT